MDNQSTSPQLIFPNVPDDFCPTGDWSNVFQLFIDNVLANGTINVPGLGDINPEEITNLQNQVTSQGLQISANSTNIASNTSDISDLQADVNSNTTSISNINASLININGQIIGIDSEVTTLQSQTASLQTSLSTTQSNVTTLQANVTNLQTSVATLQSIPVVTIRTGTTTAAVGASTINISFPALPSNSYGISITPIGSATTRANMGSYVVDAAQTATGFTIYVQDNPATVPTLRWTAIHTA